MSGGVSDLTEQISRMTDREGKIKEVKSIGEATDLNWWSPISEAIQAYL